jgi:lipopolysaccharide biosynthesis regulator YciM
VNTIERICATDTAKRRTVYGATRECEPEIQKQCIRKLFRRCGETDRSLQENRAKGLSLSDSIEEAVKYCITNDIMKSYLESNASEVFNMLFTEFNMDDAKRVWQEEALEKGMEKGMEKAAEAIALNLLQNGADPTFAAKCTGLSDEKILLLTKRIIQN